MEALFNSHQKDKLGEALTYWSDVETLMPYLETPIINSSSPGTKGNFPSCFGGKQTKAFSADRRTWAMNIHKRKHIYVYLAPLGQHHHKPCSDSAVWGLPSACALAQSLNVMWNTFRGDWTLGGISSLGGWPDTWTGFLEKWLMPQTWQVFKRHLDNALYNTFICLSALKWLGSLNCWSTWVPQQKHSIHSALFNSKYDMVPEMNLSSQQRVWPCGQIRLAEQSCRAYQLHWPKVICAPLAALLLSGCKNSVSTYSEMSSCCMIIRHSVLLEAHNQCT